MSILLNLKPTWIQYLIRYIKKYSQQASEGHSADSQFFMGKMAPFMFKSHYYISFLFLPFYTFIAFQVFGKPNNIAEHLIINSFIFGLTSIFGFLIFSVALITKSTEVYYWGQYAITIIYTLKHIRTTEIIHLNNCSLKY